VAKSDAPSDSTHATHVCGAFSPYTGKSHVPDLRGDASLYLDLPTLTNSAYRLGLAAPPSSTWQENPLPLGLLTSPSLHLKPEMCIVALMT